MKAVSCRLQERWLAATPSCSSIDLYPLPDSLPPQVQKRQGTAEVRLPCQWARPGPKGRKYDYMPVNVKKEKVEDEVEDLPPVGNVASGVVDQDHYKGFTSGFSL